MKMNLEVKDLPPRRSVFGPFKVTNLSKSRQLYSFSDMLIFRLTKSLFVCLFVPNLNEAPKKSILIRGNSRGGEWCVCYLENVGKINHVIIQKNP